MARNEPGSPGIARKDPGPRKRMIASTALLVRERGARATSLDAVLAHSGAPRGSVYHHFPGGRAQLLREATDYAGEYMARRLERATDEHPLAALDALFDDYQATLLNTDFRAGCPVVAVAIESPEEGPDLRDRALAAFERWRRALAGALERSGIETGRADELAMHTIAAFEGAIILSRAYRDLEPLNRVRRELRQRVDDELSKPEGAR
jgi:AcrR family transcriptional regulator